jgi:hypothetical protein
MLLVLLRAENWRMPEVCRVMEGSATGGTIVNPQRRTPDHPSVRALNGPSINGTALQNGESHIGPRDVVVIPAGQASQTCRQQPYVIGIFVCKLLRKVLACPRVIGLA